MGKSIMRMGGRKL